MARVSPDMSMTGRLGNLSLYKRKDLDGTFARQKGGPTKKQIKQDPQFEVTRMNNAEFGGRATATSWIMRMMHPYKSLADYNIAGPLNALMKHIQVLDTTTEKGKRSVELTKNPQLLTGFSLNKKHPFDSVIRNHIPFTFSRETLSAHIDIPALVPQVNFFTPFNYPLFALQVTMGIIPDLHFKQGRYQVAYEDVFLSLGSVNVHTEWFNTAQGSSATTLDIQYPQALPGEACSVMLTIGMFFGELQGANLITRVPYAGSVKVLAMA